MSRSMIMGALAWFGTTNLALGAWAGIHPASFSDTLADFGPSNDHLVRDYAAASIAIGVALLLATRRPGWWAPVLLVATIWNGLHAISHVIDIHDAGSLPLGITEAVLLVAATALLAALTAAAKEEP